MASPKDKQVESRSRNSIRREIKRNSKEAEKFRNRVEQFFKDTKATPDVVYSIKRDLSTKTDMEYYGHEKKRVFLKRSEDIRIAKEYVRLLKEYGNDNFAKTLLRKLSVQQNQVVRRLAERKNKDRANQIKRLGLRGIWDHAIPTRYVVSAIVNMLEKDDITDLNQLLEKYKEAGQWCLTTQENDAVCRIFNDKMPENWTLGNKNCDLLARYNAAKIQPSEPPQ